jgi:enterochelin esterase family protein
MTTRFTNRLALAISLAALAAFALSPARAADDYKLGPDSERHDGVPEGTVTQHHWTSRVFPGTERDYWVYVPKQYDAARPACVMVFQDGGNYVDLKKDFRVPIVFDNLIAKGDMPATVGIFIQPGVFKDGGRANRSFEYDTLSDQYARFLLEEILPEVEKTVTLRHDAASRAIAGASSGGICAFTVAWERPDAFSKVVSWIGSFTSIQWKEDLANPDGGQDYPEKILRENKRNLRVWLQDGSEDLDLRYGNWPLANLRMANALKANSVNNIVSHFMGQTPFRSVSIHWGRRSESRTFQTWKSVENRYTCVDSPRFPPLAHRLHFFICFDSI